VPVGTVFLVKPGDRVPLDGDVVGGASEVNQAPITGESVPVAKSPGTPVFAGTINGSGALEVKSTKLAGETTLAHIIRMVGEAQSRRAPSEQWVEKFARYYTPIVMAVALATLVIPPVLLGQPWPRWIYSSLVLLVIGCPCALVISTPVSIVAALAAAARHGILIKGGVYVETPARLRAIAFDKTGTLTEGHPSVADVISLNGGTEAQVLRIASSIESQSDHPLARAIISYARERGVTPAAAINFRSLEGRGAVATIEGLEYWLGSHRYLEERGMETPEDHRQIEKLSAAGKSVVMVGDERRPLGLITLADAVRPGVSHTIRQLREQGIERTIMLTGDNRPTAEAIGRATGVDEICAELLPEDKVAAVERLVNQYGVVAMVGDGINDAPAMGRATLGIAMGAAGSDAAIEAADIALMSDDLSKLPWLVSHSRRTLGIIRQNVALSLAVKAAFVALTLLGHASLWAAITADMGVSLLVIFNALRLVSSGPQLPRTDQTYDHA
jgi:Cd2+/Zn2+-exporting ATPase